MYSRSLIFVLIAAAAVRAEPITFEKHVRPILKARCFQCHSDEIKPKAKLDLRLPSLMIKGGRFGASDRAGQAGR